MATHIYTSVAVNYLPKARVLAESIRRFHPDWIIHLVLCDARPPWFSLADEPFDFLLTLEELGIPDLPAWMFKHALVELSTGVKGFALRKILDLPDCAGVFYFDPDIVVLSSLSQLTGEFESASVLLTPHLSEPETTREAIIDNELSTLQHGIYNLGFVGVSNSNEGRRFASWWCDRLREFCYDDIPSGLFTDQRWADLVPAYFPDCKVLRAPVYNVATWNLTHRIVSGSLRDGFFVNGQPIVFYHFSGFDSGSQQQMLNKYGSAMPSLFELRDWYVAACEQQGQQALSQAPWAYDFFDNGQRILPAHRKRYRDTPELPLRFPNPFATEEDESYFHWFERNADGHMLPPHSPTQLPPAPAPQYRIFLIGASGDTQYIAESVSRLMMNSFQSSQIFLVVNRDWEISFPLPENVETIRFEATRYEDLFAAVLRQGGETDLILVRAGVMPPPGWDLRLAWSAARYSSVATMSPLDRRSLDPAGTLSSLTNEKLDQLCYWHRQRDDPETASFLEDCVYIRVAALREMVQTQQSIRPRDLMIQAARFRFSHRLATHICCAWPSPRRTEEAAISAGKLRDLLRSHALLPQPIPLPVIAQTMTGPTLHAMHSWGGGVEQWLEDYSEADRLHENLVLKSFGRKGAYGEELRLYRYGGDAPELLRTWPLHPAITATAAFHKRYEEILREVYREFRFERVFVSSLIGHALECLRLTLPTVVICHDYYPFCSAINITFGEVCRSCEKPRLQACLEENIHNRFFPNTDAKEWLLLRTEFLRAVKREGVTFVAPSPSVRENYSRLLPELADSFVVIPHGAGDGSRRFIPLRFLPERPLRVLVIGSLAVHKGRLLLESILPEALQFAEITLLGCYDFPETFANNARIRVIPRYERAELPALIAELEPEVNLLLSVVPETFSYTLREMQSMGVPSVATRLGSFVDWVENGVTGFLCAPEPGEVLETLRRLADDKRLLEQVHRNLQTLQPRPGEEMARDYAKLTPTPYDPKRYFNGPGSPEPVWERRLQLFWRASEQDFSEDNSVTVAPLGNQRQMLRLYFPTRKTQPLHELRLDLSAQPGCFLLHRISLLNFRDETVWNWNADFSLWGEIRSAHVFPVKPIEGEPAGSLLSLTGDDSWLILPVPTALLEGMERGGSVLVDFTSCVNGDYALDLISAVQSSRSMELQAIALANSLREDLDQVRKNLDQTQGELKAAHDQLVEKSKQSQAQVQEWKRQAESLQGEIESLRGSLSWRVTEPVRNVAELGRKALRRSS